MPTFNVARGRVRTYAELPGTSDSMIAVLFQRVGEVADTLMRDYDTLAQVKAANTEATFTNYGRRPLTNIRSPGQSSIVVDDTLDRLAITADALEWTAAGGGTDNTLGRLVLAYVPSSGAADTAIIPVTFYTYVTTTDGTKRRIEFNQDGFWNDRDEV